ncbi:hypothetical protein EDB89DRAFT_1910831 [Lactarius sanguifluus]|nr:hypothetical protein EDB89DRAFT_1910831 [Lactarius sanguifluus]
MIVFVVVAAVVVFFIVVSTPSSFAVVRSPESPSSLLSTSPGLSAHGARIGPLVVAAVLKRLGATWGKGLDSDVIGQWALCQYSSFFFGFVEVALFPAVFCKHLRQAHAGMTKRLANQLTYEWLEMSIGDATRETEPEMAVKSLTCEGKMSLNDVTAGKDSDGMGRAGTGQGPDCA